VNVRFVPIALFASVALPATMEAQRVHHFDLRWDNDFLAVRGNGKPADYGYTQGLEVAVGFDRDTDAQAPRYRVALGQRIYTPRADGEHPVPGERPYAGWLYAAVSSRSGGPHARFTIGGELGITGPAALGEVVQNGVHRLTRSDRQQGWGNQLSPEIAFALRAQAELVRTVRRMELRPYGEVTLGTLRDGLAVGLNSSSGEGRGIYARAGIRGEWVARDLFLDGNTFRRSVRAERHNLLGTADVALGYRWSNWSVGYGMSARTREYTAQREPHRYGSVSVGWRRY
jgi:hypothetical protein